MCTVSINVNEKLLQDVLPELDNMGAIKQWVQQLVNLRIQELAHSQDEVMDVETARRKLHQMIKDVYA